MSGEEGNRQQEISDVAHPQHVSETAVAPVVDRLGKEKQQRQKSQPLDINRPDPPGYVSRE